MMDILMILRTQTFRTDGKSFYFASQLRHIAHENMLLLNFPNFGAFLQFYVKVFNKNQEIMAAGAI